MAGKEDKSATDNNKGSASNDEELGAAGKKALEAEREARKKLEAQVAKLTKSADQAAKDKQASEDAKKDALEKAQEEIVELQRKISASERDQLRLEVASALAPEGIEAKKLRNLAKRLTGESREELEADAKELFGEFLPAKKGEEGENGNKSGAGEAEGDQSKGFLGPRTLPKEDLHSGATGKGDDEGEADPDKIAETIFKAGRI